MVTMGDAAEDKQKIQNHQIRQLSQRTEEGIIISNSLLIFDNTHFQRGNHISAKFSSYSIDDFREKSNEKWAIHKAFRKKQTTFFKFPPFRN